MQKLLLICLTALFAGCTQNSPAPESKKELTLSIIKPDAVKENHIGEILSLFEKNGLRIAAIKMMRLDKERAKKFYAVHKSRPFYEELTTFMSSGPVIAIVLEGENAVAKNRELMGSTNPKEAAPGTLRALYAKSTGENAVHGSDSLENARHEIAFLFAGDEIFPRY